MLQPRGFLNFKANGVISQGRFSLDGTKGGLNEADQLGKGLFGLPKSWFSLLSKPRPLKDRGGGALFTPIFVTKPWAIDQSYIELKLLGHICMDKAQLI